MKKLLSVVVALVVVLGLTSTAFAAGSVSDVVDVKGTDANGAAVELTIADMDQNADPWLTVEEAAEIIGEGTQPSELAIPWQKDVTAATTPVTLTFTASGVTSSQTIYLFHYKDGAWAIEASAAGAEVSAEVDSTSPFALVIKTPAKEAGKSADTGENNAVPFALAVVIAAGALAVVLNSRKRNA